MSQSLLLEHGWEDVYKRFLKGYNNPGGLSGIPTGFKRLDNFLDGLQPSDLIVVAARVSMGKTAFTLQIAKNIAESLRAEREEAKFNGDFVPEEHNEVVVFFSAEMSFNQLLLRLWSSETGISISKLRKGAVESVQLPNVVEAGKNLVSDLPLIVDDTSGITTGQIREKLNSLSIEYKPKAIFVDYLQILGDEKGINENERLSHITSNLKAIAKEFDVPVICLSQLNRSVDVVGGDGKPLGDLDRLPQLHHLRGSGSIEQDADVIMFLYRPFYYDAVRQRLDQIQYDNCWVLIRKNRNGMLGSEVIRFVAHTASFEDYDDRTHYEIVRRKKYE